MRSSVVTAGGLIVLTGIALYVALAGLAWLAFIAGGVVILACGFVLEEVTEHLEAPLGHHFCPFCSTAVADGTPRCGHCNGLQEWVAPSKSAPQAPA